MAKPQNVLVPVKLDAFIFNEKVCNGSTELKEAKIAPITQPNYTFLRLDDHFLQNDVLPHVDLHHSTPASHNPRFTDLGTRQPRKNRQGVYVHWMIPRIYRSGTTSTNPEEKKPDPSSSSSSSSSPPAAKDEDPSKPPKKPEEPETDNSTPAFRDVPPRWLVIRKIHDLAAVEPNEASELIPEVQAWVIESDRRRRLDQLPAEMDLQVDVSPYVYANTKEKVSIQHQAEVFIGYKEDASTWHKDEKPEDDKHDRVDLNLLSSSNQLFADYQPHNSNVFSMVDNFEYFEGTGKNRVRKTLTKANASYYVLGWHTHEEKEPFSLSETPVHSQSSSTRKKRLQSLQMNLNTPKGQDPDVVFKEWLAFEESTRVLCHGAMYNVEWDLFKKPKVLADEYSLHINNAIPVAVGTTPMDALLSYVHVHKDHSEKHDLEKSIDDINRLLHARDDGVEAQREAADMVSNWNFERSSGGQCFHLAGQDGPTSTQPSEDAQKKLVELNQRQQMLDHLARTIKQLRWEMFSYWWNFLSGAIGSTGKPGEPNTEWNVNQLKKRVYDLEDQARAEQEKIADLRKKLPHARPGVLSAFYQQRDPTLLVGGVKSGWPHDYHDNLLVRLDTQTVSPSNPLHSDPATPPPPDSPWGEFFQNTLRKLPPELISAAEALVNEFIALDPAEGPPKLSDSQIVPLFHDQGPSSDKTAPWRDRWEKTQPWFPLFLEWEVEYTHIPFDKYWSLGERTSKQDTYKKLRHGIKPDVILHKEPLDDSRTLSGRVLILPQASFSLQAKVNQLLSESPPDVLKKIPEKTRGILAERLHELAFLSAPLSGFTDHLLTLMHGSHVKPNYRPPGGKVQPIEEAAKAGSFIGLRKPELSIIDIESDVTPYGKSVRFTDDSNCAFKPVTHGQFKFTKINIIDKFGQAIHAIDPTPSKDAPLPIFPCISEYYEPQSIIEGSDIPNTVKEAMPGHCEYVQVPPQINQLARLNSAFVKLDNASDSKSGPALWRPVTEWENPIWGWVVINYAAYAIQLFCHDGTFYSEVRIGGPKGASQSQAWLPFDQPPKSQKVAPETKQLQRLAEKLTEPTYIRAFADMINAALESSQEAPSAYAEFQNSVVGRPLALANMGWSLELAADAYANQSVLNNDSTKDPPCTLLPSPGKELYRFPVKFGDRQRDFDGLVGYFGTSPTPTPDNQLLLETVYTFKRFGDPRPPKPTAENGPVKYIDENYPEFEAFWIRPDKISHEDLELKRNKHLSRNVFGALFDPFLPIHAYSGILPVEALSLPSWTWQAAMKQMTAFFHMGPLIITKDLPDFDEKHSLKHDYAFAKDGVFPGYGLPVPAMQTSDWTWLQPYEKAEGGEDSRRYMPLGLEATDSRPKFEKPPYTAVEGYLQLRKEILKK